MCEGLSTAGWIIAGIITAASATTATVVEHQKLKAQKKSVDAQAEDADANAQRLLIHAENVELQANQKRLALYNQMQQRQGEGRAEYAAGNVVLGANTEANYEADIANAYDLDLKNLNYDVASQKWQLQVQATDYENQARALRAQSKDLKQGIRSTDLGGVITDLALGGLPITAIRTGKGRSWWMNGMQSFANSAGSLKFSSSSTGAARASAAQTSTAPASGGSGFMSRMMTTNPMT